MSSSNGTSTLAATYGTWRVAQKRSIPAMYSACASAKRPRTLAVTVTSRSSPVSQS